jgi:hypothetical protein
MPATKASAHAPVQTHRGSLEIIGDTQVVRNGTLKFRKRIHFLMKSNLQNLVKDYSRFFWWRRFA